MKLGFRAKLVLVSFAILVISLVAANAWLAPELDHTLTGRIRDDLKVRLALVERETSLAATPLDDLDGWDRFADELGTRARARITVIRLDGVVLGDSEVPRAELEHVENHGRRPEVEAALAAGEGASARRSSTVHHRMMYVAVPFRRDGAVAGVIRAATPLADVDAALARVRWLFAAGSFLALVVAGLLTTAVVSRTSKLVRSLTAAARRMAEGDLDARTHVWGPDELGQLGRTLDHLAGSLATTLGELRSERDRMSGILTAMQEGVLVLDEDGRIVLLNPALRAMLLLGGDTAGKHPLEVIRHAELDEILERARAADSPVSGEIEVGGVKPRRLLVHASTLHGTPSGLLAVVFDVTDLRRLETLRRDFVANVSHELRTPVTTLRSAAETLRGGAAGDRVAAERFLAIIERNAERLQLLVEDLLDLSKIESREFHLRPEPIELPEVIAHAVSLMRERADRRRIRLLSETAAGLPPAHADRRALEQVLANLVDNAIKYSGDGATVTVGATPQDGGVRVYVRDDGPGIDARHLARLFERFYRVDAGRSRDQGGTGLGLSIVKHLVEAMGGRIAVESAPGEGSTFFFTLPLQLRPSRA